MIKSGNFDGKMKWNEKKTNEKTAEKNIEKSKNMRIISEPTKDKQACF